jgi:hypothetical protein
VGIVLQRAAAQHCCTAEVSLALPAVQQGVMAYSNNVRLYGVSKPSPQDSIGVRLPASGCTLRELHRNKTDEDIMCETIRYDANVQQLSALLNDRCLQKSQALTRLKCNSGNVIDSKYQSFISWRTQGVPSSGPT